VRSEFTGSACRGCRRYARWMAASSICAGVTGLASRQVSTAECHNYGIGLFRVLELEQHELRKKTRVLFSSSSCSNF